MTKNRKGSKQAIKAIKERREENLNNADRFLLSC